MSSRASRFFCDLDQGADRSWCREHWSGGISKGGASWVATAHQLGFEKFRPVWKVVNREAGPRSRLDSP